MGRLTGKRAVQAGLLAGGTGIAAATTAAAWHWLLRRPLPRQRGTIELPGLDGRVRVRRDRWGVPHVEAEEARDLYFAQGFCHGQDRLWQMDFYRRVAEGRVAEIAGDEGLAVDRLLRTLGIRRAAEREAAALDPVLRERLERFCEGVNAAADSAKAPPFELRLLKLEFAPWHPVDILSLGKLLAFGLSTNWERELLRADMVRTLGPELTAKLDPGYPADNPVVNQEPWSGDGLAVVEQIDAVRRARSGSRSRPAAPTTGRSAAP
jgi:penicillin amidase